MPNTFDNALVEVAVHFYDKGTMSIDSMEYEHDLWLTPIEDSISENPSFKTPAQLDEAMMAGKPCCFLTDPCRYVLDEDSVGFDFTIVGDNEGWYSSALIASVDQISKADVFQDDLEEIHRIALIKRAAVKKKNGDDHVVRMILLYQHIGTYSSYDGEYDEEIVLKGAINLYKLGDAIEEYAPEAKECVNEEKEAIEEATA